MDEVENLDVDNDAGWGELFDAYFVKRIETRYFVPLEAIEKLSKNGGEGFSAVAIWCSLMEFLETTQFGVSFKHNAGVKFEAAQKGCNNYIYGDGNVKDIICSFLLNSHGNSKALCTTDDEANSFYSNVRCAVLHDARTTEGWVIWRGNGPDPIETADELKVVNWVSLRDHLKKVVKELRKSVIECPERRKAFKRKFDALCD